MKEFDIAADGSIAISPERLMVGDRFIVGESSMVTVTRIDYVTIYDTLDTRALLLTNKPNGNNLAGSPLTVKRIGFEAEVGSWVGFLIPAMHIQYRFDNSRLRGSSNAPVHEYTSEKLYWLITSKEEPR